MDEQSERIYFSDKCYLDCRNRELYYDGELVPVRIRPLDYKIICAMSANPGLFTYDGLVKACWSVDAQTRGVTDGTVRQHIRAIRNWHSDVDAVIETSIDVGYKYLGPKCGNAPSAAEKTETKPRAKVNRTPSVLLTGTVSATAGRQSCEELLDQVEYKVLAEQNPCAELQALRETVSRLSKPSPLKAAINRLEILRDTYELSGELLLRLEAAILAAQRKLFEQRYYLALDRLEEQRTQQARASLEETIEGIEKDIQGVDEELTRVGAELARQDKSNAYVIN